MALPKEPRQKMINLMYLVLTALLAMNVSSEILNAFKVVDKSLTNSNTNLTTASGLLYKSLADKLTKTESAEMAKIWQPKAEEAHKLANDMDAYINTLKQELMGEAGLEMVDGKPNFKEDDLDAATRLFGDGEHGKKKGPELLAKLNAFKQAILNIDTAIRTQFEKTLPIETDAPTGQDGSKKEFTEGYFHMVPTVAALTILSKFQNNIKNAENQVVTFCHSKIGEVVIKFDKFGVLTSQNSNYLMPGADLEITAGVGAYSSTSSAQVSINGSSVAVVDGKATYTTKAGDPGDKSIPIVVHYKDQYGKDQSQNTEIKYTVGKPGGAAIMLDKMNVFYIGVDNPVTISSSTGWDRTQVTMTGGTISQTNGKGNVRVTTAGNATINVIVDGKSTPFQFRVKRIPDPVFKIGPGGARMPSVAFKNQQFCRAELENFDFDARFTVISATVYFSGANFSNVQTATLTGNNLGALSAYMQRCGPGSSITFENIKVQGPDGAARTIKGEGITLF